MPVNDDPGALPDEQYWEQLAGAGPCCPIPADVVEAAIEHLDAEESAADHG